MHQLFLSEKEIETPLGMDDIKQKWKWAERRLPSNASSAPDIPNSNGGRREWNPPPRSQPGPSQDTLPVDSRQPLMGIAV